VILAAVIAIEVATFPYGDIASAVQKPSPASFLRVAADVATGFVPFDPQARVAAFALNVSVIGLAYSHPAHNPIAEAQLSMHRGGRRAGHSLDGT
jgi:hypothetical protein